MLKVATKVNKKEEASKKTEQQPKQQEQTVKAAEQPVEGPPQDINENAELDQYLQSKGFSGTAVVVKNGKVLLNKGYGLANQEKKIPNNSETTFYIGSISKAFVATAIMQLKDQNKLQTEDIVTKYIPGFPHGEGLKLSHLLTHTSGIPEYEAGSEDISHEELLKRIGEQKRLANPGGNGSILTLIILSLLILLKK